MAQLTNEFASCVCLFSNINFVKNELFFFSQFDVNAFKTKQRNETENYSRMNEIYRELIG